MPASLPPQSAAPANEAKNLPGEPESVAVFTLALWLLVFTVGAMGFLLRYERPRSVVLPEMPVLAQTIQVDLTTEIFPPPEPVSIPPDLPVPPAPEIVQPPAAVQPIAVAQPITADSFPVPMEAPVRLVELKGAEHTLLTVTNRPVVTTTTAPSVQPRVPQVQQLTFGMGEGRQPAPTYPRAALRQGQEGVVVVRMKVDSAGHVQSVAVAQPSSWPLLDQAAVTTVRERWQFPTGVERIYEVPIRFELTK